MPDRTLNEVLKSLGYTTADTKHCKKDIIKDGEVVVTGESWPVWVWLYETGQYKYDIREG